jgi:hypothetical protein
VSDGWKPCETDPCVFTLRAPGDATAGKSSLPIGLILLHVDDLLCAGDGDYFFERLRTLHSRFDVGSFRVGEGEFLGSHLRQDMTTGTIEVSQSHYVEGMVPIRVSPAANEETAATPEQISAFRALLGELGWLSKQTRGDLSVQVSFGQQSLPEPKVKDLRRANNALRRAKQHSELGLRYAPIPIKELAYVMHSDASLANIKKTATQGGYVIGATHRKLLANQTAPWQPVAWRSGRLKRVIVSTLASEAQAYLLGVRELEWVLTQTMEIISGLTDFARREEVLRTIPSAGVTDAKSLYDSLVQPTSANIQDREAGLDVICIKQVLARTGSVPRWAPGTLNVADVMAKDVGSAADLYGSCVRQGSYTLASEEEMLRQRATERDLRQKVGEEKREKNLSSSSRDAAFLRVKNVIGRRFAPLDHGALSVVDEMMCV